MVIYTIYKATNIITGDSYIGFDSLPKRQLKHLKMGGQCPKFHNALKYYGKHNFIWDVIFQGWDYYYVKNKAEVLLIEEYNTFLGPGYNLTPGGDGPKHGAETRKILSEKGKGNKNSLGCIRNEEFREKLRNRIITSETREKIRQNSLGRKPSLASKEKMRLAKLGNKHCVGRICSKETREKMRMALIKKNRTERAAGEN